MQRKLTSDLIQPASADADRERRRRQGRDRDSRSRIIETAVERIASRRRSYPDYPRYERGIHGFCDRTGLLEYARAHATRVTTDERFPLTAHCREGESNAVIECRLIPYKSEPLYFGLFIRPCLTSPSAHDRFSHAREYSMHLFFATRVYRHV